MRGIHVYGLGDNIAKMLNLSKLICMYVPVPIKIQGMIYRHREAYPKIYDCIK